jgi:endonuclease/exonuclease/phosphatase (EEP) superfamily protein YafD
MSRQKQNPPKRRISLWGLVDAAGAILIALTPVSFLGRYGWPLELASHFRVQYVGLLFCWAVLSGVAKRFGRMALALVTAALCLPMFFDAYLHPERREATGSAFKAMVMHVNPSDGQFDSALALIRSERPRFVVMEDVGPEWEAIMKRELAAMPEARFVSRNGTAFLSIRPWDRIENAGITSWGFPGLKISFSEPDLTVFALHVPAPISASWREERLNQFHKLMFAVNEARTGSDGSPTRSVLVMGDLNCSPWSPLFEELLVRAGLESTRKGFGIKPTWPSNMPPFLIPIDHVLATKEHFQVIDVRVGPYIGSDHYPLIVTLKWASHANSPVPH